MSILSPSLWFESQAEEAATLYTSVIPNSRILKTTRAGEGGPFPAGTVIVVEFELDGQRFLALNGGPQFQFTEAVSFVVDCQTQEEIDRYWSLLAEGGEEGQCGWLKDRFGLSWQVVPRILGELMSHPDPAISGATAGAMMSMKKLDIAGLKSAAGLG